VTIDLKKYSQLNLCKSIVLTFGLALALLSCSLSARLETDCTGIKDDKLLALLTTETSVEMMPQWIKDTYKVPDDDIRLLETIVGPQFDWRVNDKRYFAIIQGNKLVHVAIQSESQALTMGQVLTCFGSPEWYRATMHGAARGDLFFFELWYPAQGVFVEGGCRQGSFFSQCPPATPELKDLLAVIILVPPNPREQMVADVFPQVKRQEVLDTKLNDLQAWPGSLEQLNIQWLLDRAP
jgi:hypothetical protein